VEFHGLDGVGGPLYVGSGCFHQREVLCGRKYLETSKLTWKMQSHLSEVKGSVNELEERAKQFASCNYELNTPWGNEVSSFTLASKHLFHLPHRGKPKILKK